MNQNARELGGPLQLRIWTTRGCYFVLSDRLKRKSRFSVGATTIIAFYIFSVALMLLSFGSDVPEITSRSFNTFSIVLSVFLIIITLLETSKQYDVDSHSALMVAHQLEKLHNEYELHLIMDGEANHDITEHEKIRKRYAEILYEAKVNRKEIDYHVFQMNNAKALKIGFFFRIFNIVRIWIEFIFEYWLYVLMVLVPPGAMVLLLCRLPLSRG